MSPCFGSVSLRRRICGISVAAVLLSIVGCGGGGEGDKFKGERGSVTGKVTYKGSPIPAKSVVSFQSKVGSYSATGTINDKGEYTLSYDGKSTLPAVAYVVQIAPPPTAAASGPMDPSKVGTAAPAKVEAPPFPAKYGAAVTSGLESTVKAGANKTDFELVD